MTFTKTWKVVLNQSLAALEEAEEAAEYYDANYRLLLPNVDFKSDVDIDVVALEIKKEYAGDRRFVEDVSALIRVCTN